MNASNTNASRGAPIIVVALILSSWIGVRSMIWENPFPAGSVFAPITERLFAETSDSDAIATNVPSGRTSPRRAFEGNFTAKAGAVRVDEPISTAEGHLSTPERDLVHHLLWVKAMGTKIAPSEPGGPSFHAFARPDDSGGFEPTAPPRPAFRANDRWSLDAWAFWRQGSVDLNGSEGRIPTYGASQLGAKLIYRLAPRSTHDSQAYLRVYRALVDDGENELAVGASVRPMDKLPIRLSAEIRATRRADSTELRPAAIATTEIVPQRLPAGFSLEAYGGAGYVGGRDATAFADGQVTAMREVISFDGPTDGRVRFSVGAGTWGGTQRDASRLDVGPTARLDMRVGTVPARLSVDWRERVAGDAAPGSGLTATLSTRF